VIAAGAARLTGGLLSLEVYPKGTPNIPLENNFIKIIKNNKK